MSTITATIKLETLEQLVNVNPEWKDDVSAYDRNRYLQAIVDKTDSILDLRSQLNPIIENFIYAHYVVQLLTHSVGETLYLPVNLEGLHDDNLGLKVASYMITHLFGDDPHVNVVLNRANRAIQSILDVYCGSYEPLSDEKHTSKPDVIEDMLFDNVHDLINRMYKHGFIANSVDDIDNKFEDGILLIPLQKALSLQV